MQKLLRSFQILGGALLVLGVGWLLFGRPHSGSLARGKTELKVKGLWVGLWPRGIANGEALAEFQKQNPAITVRNWVSFRIPGDLNIASEMMSFAARTAPDVTFTYIHRFQFFVEQGFYHRLNEFIGDDTNGDGVIDPAEVRWKPWLDLPPLFRQMGMRGTDIYALPQGISMSIMIYRRDLLRAAGLDPQNFPTDFPAFLRAGQKICALSLKQPTGRRIYALPRNLDGFFQLLLRSGGGCSGVGDLYGSNGQLLGHILPEDNLGERVRALGLKPAQVTVKWRAVFDDEPTRRALDAIWKLCWQPWILNPNSGEPLDLTAENLAQGAVTCPQTGTTIVLADVPGGIQHGICRPARMQEGVGESDLDLLRDGEMAMMLQDSTVTAALGKDSERYGFALPPALDVGGTPAVIAIPMLYGLNSDLRGDKLQAAWKLLAFQSGPDWNRIVTRHLLDHGYADSVSPLDVERFGFTNDLAKLPENSVRVNRAAMKVARVIPCFAGYAQAETEFLARTLHKITDSPEVAIGPTLRSLQKDVNERILRPPGEGKGFVAKLFAALLLIGSVGAILWGIRSVVRLPQPLNPSAATAARPRVKLAFWCLVLPAVASVLLWNYYPMLRGFVLAFQEYRLGGNTKWVGLANFVEGAWSARFWYTMWNSVKFIALNVGLGFCAPIILAILLNEIPRGKYFFRTIFFLPSVTSGLVIMLLWMVLYEPSADGTFNHFVKPVIDHWNQWLPTSFAIEWPIRWLQNPKLAMLCVIIPAIWSAMGTGCLIYLAALQSVSNDLYEAAEIDGAGFWKKLIHITIPYLRPLLIINLVGAFIGSAHGWGNIFIMTGGGPDLATQVASLEIWVNSFVFLRFGMATAQAWVLGAMLIGFTVWQIKQMQKVEFRRAGGR